MSRPKKAFKYGVGEVVTTKYSIFTVVEQMREKRSSSDIKDKKYLCTCNRCGEQQLIRAGTLEAGIGSCRACSEIKSYPSKYFYWFMKQLGIGFETEYSPSWLGRYRFDYYFVVDDKPYIVEIDGAQHYTHGHKRLTLEEIKVIDDLKDSLAINNGIEVIRLDCRESKGKMIEQVIKNSKLTTIFDLSNMDWKKCSYMAISNRIREFCELWNGGHNSTAEISKLTGFNQNYISKCLKECASLGFCNYNPQEEALKGSFHSTNGKKVICLDTGDTFPSAVACSKKSEEYFGVFLKSSGITRICRGEREKYKGYRFQYIDEMF